MTLPEIVAMLGRRQDLLNDPPVLVDIGASMALNPRWRVIAPLCECLAFDADDREFQYVTRTDAGYRRLHVINKIVVDRGAPKRRPFHLTRNPYCSSLLRPAPRVLAEFAYAASFEVERVVELETVDLVSALQHVGLRRIDWFKVDSQGIDLRLFSSLPEGVQRNCAVLEFEPGLLDVYEGEGSLPAVLSHVAGLDYFMVDFLMRKTVRMRPAVWDELFASRLAREAAETAVPGVPGWCEITWMHRRTEVASPRDLIVSWLFAMVLNHPELAVALARQGETEFREDVFSTLRVAAETAVRRLLWRPRNVAGLLRRALRKVVPG